VSILGDAAHAIPPSTGQGANQVFEDSYTYALILDKCKGDSLGRVMPIWQNGRQGRIDLLMRLAEIVNARRLPQETSGDGQADQYMNDSDIDLDVIFKPDFDAMVDRWIQSSN
jgi:2-polyprenyl-6-methoxyphenol hydroxylase-like FAD-dependent oxidoreductase